MTEPFTECKEKCERHGGEPCTSHHIQGPDVHSHKQEGSPFRHVWKSGVRSILGKEYPA